MPGVPVFCDSCSALLIHTGIIGGAGPTNVTFRNCTIGPCPSCGGRMRVLDGTFKLLGNTIELLSGPQATVEMLTRIAAIFKEASAKRSSPEEVVERIRKEAPEFRGLGDILPRTKAELYAFLALVLALIPILQTQFGRNVPPPTPVQIINQIEINQSFNATPPPMSMRRTVPGHNLRKTPSRKTGRNDPCPCGSGTKFKKCHGKP